MSTLKIDFDGWESYPDALREVGDTTARLRIDLDGLCLTRNEDTLCGEVRDDVNVSLYPLALWFASSWWRLNHERSPVNAGREPSHGWRMSHELAAADMGFVWPSIIFAAAPGGARIQVWARLPEPNKGSPVKYVNGLDGDHFVPREAFAREVSSFIERVTARLLEVGCHDTDLAHRWQAVREDLDNPQEYRKRCIEAELGFDPEECPDALLNCILAPRDIIRVFAPPVI